MLYVCDLEQAERGRDCLSGSLMSPEFEQRCSNQSHTLRQAGGVVGLYARLRHSHFLPLQHVYPEDHCIDLEKTDLPTHCCVIICLSI